MFMIFLKGIFFVLFAKKMINVNPNYRLNFWSYGVIIITSQEANKKSVTLFVNLFLLSDNSRVLSMTRHSILS